MKTIILSTLFVLSLAIYGQANAQTVYKLDETNCWLIKTKTSCFIKCGNAYSTPVKTDNKDCGE